MHFPTSRRLLKWKNIFLILLFLSLFYIFISFGQGDYYAFDESQLDDSCREYLKNISTTNTAKVLLVDIRLLRDLYRRTCPNKYEKLKVAIRTPVGQRPSRELIQQNPDAVYFEQSQMTNYIKIFDTETRIVPLVEFSLTADSVLIPTDIVLFIEYWNRSKYVECANIYIDRNQDLSTTEEAKNLDQAKVDAMSYFSERLANMDVWPYLHGETLLGWYRECGLLPNTDTARFAVQARHYRSLIIEEFKDVNADQSHHLYMYQVKRIYGKEPYVHELIFTMNTNLLEFNVLLMRNNENYSYIETINNYNGNHEKLQYPKFNANCACDLMDRIFWIPCNPEEIIKIQYGPKWNTDIPLVDQNVESSRTLNGDELADMIIDFD